MNLLEYIFLKVFHMGHKNISMSQRLTLIGVVLTENSHLSENVDTQISISSKIVLYVLTYLYFCIISELYTYHLAARNDLCPWLITVVEKLTGQTGIEIKSFTCTRSY